MSPKSTTVPFVDLAAQHAEIADEVEAGLDAVFAATAFVGGPPVADFEHEYAAFVGVDHCVGVANGTDALELALRAVGVGAGGEVDPPGQHLHRHRRGGLAHRRRAGARGRRRRAPAHRPRARSRARSPTAPRPSSPSTSSASSRRSSELAQICGDAGVPLVEDAAQSQGARWRGRVAGALGTVAATSFYPGKNLGAAGDAGAVTTDDADDRRPGPAARATTARRPATCTT